MATRKTPMPAATVDAAAAALVLAALATTAPAQHSPHVCRAALQLQHELDLDVLDIGWGLRAGDQS